MVFDVEVCMEGGNRFPTLAACLTERGWYTWTSPYLANGRHKDLLSLDASNLTEPRLISIPNPKNAERIVIGHNIGFDRVRILEEYLTGGTKNMFIDTLSLHCCIAGLSSQQLPQFMKLQKENVNVRDSKENRQVLLPSIILFP
jgi:DNA polymerase gamma 1